MLELFKTSHLIMCPLYNLQWNILWLRPLQHTNMCLTHVRSFWVGTKPHQAHTWETEQDNHLQTIPTHPFYRYHPYSEDAFTAPSLLNKVKQKFQLDKMDCHGKKFTLKNIVNIEENSNKYESLKLSKLNF